MSRHISASDSAMLARADHTTRTRKAEVVRRDGEENCTRVVSADLQQVLADLLPARGIARRIAQLERKPAICRSSYPLEELTVHFDDQTCLELIFKDVNPDSLSADARRAKPAFLDNPYREIETYCRVLNHLPVGTATYYGSVADKSAKRYWLLLEKVSGQELYQFGDFDVWKGAARWLANFHSQSSVWQSTAVGLIQHDPAYYARWMQRACEFCARPKDSDQPEEAARLSRLAAGYPGVIDELTALPVTLIHGEYYASNILVRDQPTSLQICPVDWERAAIGPGLVDLAALTAGKWSEQEKLDLAMAYYEALPAPGEAFASFDHFLHGLNLCRLHLSVQWLGWSPDWSPPSEHKQDWLAEAEAAFAALESSS